MLLVDVLLVSLILAVYRFDTNPRRYSSLPPTDPAAKREALAIGEDRQKVFDMRTLTINDRIYEEGVDAVVRCVWWTEPQLCYT